MIEDTQAIKSRDSETRYFREDNRIVKAVKKGNKLYYDRVYVTPSGLEWMACPKDSVPHTILVALKEIH